MDCRDTASTSLTLTALARAAKLPPKTFIKQLYDDHAISTVAGLRDVLNDTDATKSLPPQWCQQLAEAMKKLSVASDPRERPPPFAAVQWRPNPESAGPSIVVTQGDLTTCEANAIVNPANSRLSHGGGLAAVIARCGGQVIHDESQAWIRQRKSVPVGKAMVTSSGELPCRYVIHTVGPNLTGSGSSTPTQEQAQQLRNAVWSVLCEAEKLGLATIAIPGISSGAYGYPRDLAAREIVSECARFCRARSPTAKSSTPTTIKTIVLMNNDTPTCESFRKALEEAAADSLQSFNGDPYVREEVKALDQIQ